MNSSINPVQVRALERSMQPEKFDQVIEAIASGKYSWACVLMLRFAGYNPLHYIPYSTYNRIVKDGEVKTNSSAASPEMTKIQDLAHLESIQEESQMVSGGASWCARWRSFSDLIISSKLGTGKHL
jgi:hypothetical protein